jgi:hypothetical protein
MNIKDNEKFKSGIFTQIVYFNIFFGILSAFIIPLFLIIYIIILQKNRIDIQVEDSTFKSNLLSICLMIILPGSFAHFFVTN